MKILSTKEIESSATSVIVLKGKQDISSHLFYRSLPDGDQILISKFLQKTSFEKPLIRSVFLPSGNRVLLAGVGDKEKFNSRKAMLAMRGIVAAAKKDKLRILQIDPLDFSTFQLDDLNTIAETLATQSEIANYDHVTYRTPTKEGWDFIEKIFIFAKSDIKIPVEKGQIIGQEINKARELCNTPGGDMTPTKLADAAKKAIQGLKVSFSVLGVPQMKKLGMGGILGVSQGSSTPPRFIIMEYKAGPKNEAPVVIVGKGITFDSGGLNIKPSDHIYEMHMDMSGGASVIHIISALAKIKAKKNVIGIIPAAENMPSGSSYRPGDVLRTMAGKTIEILNTDAEGRVVMADGLEYSKKYKPRLVMDISTLTGSAAVALGQRASALFTNDQRLETELRKEGERTMDLVWPLPLWEEFEEDVKGTFGDWANTGKDKYGGAICGAVFLWQFIKPFPFVHLDIAPRMTSIEEDNLAKGAAGASVNLLVHFLAKY